MLNIEHTLVCVRMAACRILQDKILYLVMSPQYHSASCSEYTGGARQLLFMVEDTGFVDLGGRARRQKKRER